MRAHRLIGRSKSIGRKRSGPLSVLAGLALGLPVITLVMPSTAAMAATATPDATTALPAAVPALPKGAVVEAPLPADQSLSFTVVLAVPNPTALSQFVTAVSTPGSPSYGDHLGPGQFRSRFGPSDSTISATRAWLTGYGLRPGETTSDGLSIPVTGTVSEVATAFETSLVSVRLASGAGAITPTRAPSVPTAARPFDPDHHRSQHGRHVAEQCNLPTT